MNTKNYRIIWFACILLLILLSCQTLTRPLQEVREAEATVAKIATQVEGVATLAEPLMATAKAFATDNMDFVETVQAVVTEGAPLLGTAEAYATEHPEAGQTLEALATQGVNLGDAPPDIPVLPEGEIKNFLGSELLVMYSTIQTYSNVLNFYKESMIANGWQIDDDGTYELPETAILNYRKDGRKATVSITSSLIDQTTLVTIVIHP